MKKHEKRKDYLIEILLAIVIMLIISLCFYAAHQESSTARAF